MKLNGITKKKQLIVSSIGVAVALSLLFVVVGGFAWFSNNKNTDATGMNVKVDAGGFELYRDTELDYESELTDYFDHTENVKAIEKTTPSTPSIFVQLNIENGEKIEPGAYGHVTFYIIPKEGDNYSKYNVNLLSRGFKESEEGEELVLTEENSENVKDLMKGHILFFEERTPVSGSTGPYYYSKMITNNFEVDSEEMSLTTKGGYQCYEVNIYWIWAFNIAQIVFDENNPRLHSHPLFNDNEEREEIRNLIIDKPDEFFYWDIDPEIDFDENGVFFENKYVQINNGYNNGDQLIGDSIKYFVIEVIVNKV